MKNAVFIPGEVPSLKNSKVKAKNGIFSSKAVRDYLTLHGIKDYNTRKYKKKCKYGGAPTLIVPHVIKHPTRLHTWAQHVGTYFDGVEYPAKIGYHVVRKTRAGFDYNNVNQIIFDLLTAHQLIIDDNMKYAIPVAMNRLGTTEGTAFWTHDPHAPGVWLKIL